MSKNDITGDNLKSRANNKAFNENFDRIFGSKVKASSLYGEMASPCKHCTSERKCPDHGKSLIDYRGE